MQKWKMRNVEKQIALLIGNVLMCVSPSNRRADGKDPPEAGIIHH